MNKQEIQIKIAKAVEIVKESKPLAGSITNSVTINFVANAQLAVGGTAAMVYLPDEGETLAKLGGAMYINVGTLLPIYEDTLPHTAKVLFENQKPGVLDPVAIGIGSLRTKVLEQFKPYKPSVIRGNASEIIALAGLWNLEGGTDTSTVHGVDSTVSVRTAKSAAVALASWTGGAVAVSGEMDLITDGSTVAVSYGGSEMMTAITGSGCSLGGVMAVYASVADPFIAALSGASVYNLAGMRAEQHTDGTGSFQIAFIDELYKASAQDISMNEFTLEEV